MPVRSGYIKRDAELEIRNWHKKIDGISYELVAAADGNISRKLRRPKKKQRKDDSIVMKKIRLLIIGILLVVSSGCFPIFIHDRDGHGGPGGGGHEGHEDHGGGERGGEHGDHN